MMADIPEKWLVDILRRQIQKRRKMFLRRFAAMRKSPTRKKTHTVSTVIRRLLVMHRMVKTIYGRQMLRHSALVSLKSFRKMLGDVRDAQEIGLKFQRLYEESQNPFFQSVVAVLGEQQEMLQEELLQAARAVDVRSLDRSLKKKRVQKILSGASKLPGREYVRSLYRQFAQAIEAGLAEKTPLRLHQIRIQFKKLRYAAEFLASILGLNDDVLKDLHHMQDIIGEAHDWFVLRQATESLIEKLPEEGVRDAMLIIGNNVDKSHEQAWEIIMSRLPQLKQRLG